MKLYKLTDSKGSTYGNTQWGENVTHSGTGKGKLCGPGFIHAYTNPHLAVLLNPIHACFDNPLLWEAEGDIAKEGHGLKVGCISLTTIRQIPLPAVTTEQRVEFGIRCALRVYDDPAFVRWAHDWLSGKDRTEAAARAAEAAARAARAAARAARAAARAARAAAWAAEAAAWAAEAAAWAAEAAAEAADIDLIAIVNEVFGEQT